MADFPPLDGLRAFEAAARHMSFQDAADELCITPSAVSHRMRGLENALGVRLFRRHHRRIALTDAGRAYLPPVRAALDQIRAATRTVTGNW